MDDLARYNQARWEALARANILYSRPYLDLDEHSARRVVDAQGMLGDVAGRDVLCLASGGGQQSVAFALLGARVVVLDLSPTQLERDRVAAAHYGVEVRTVLGDMRDLACFEPASFDVVWQAYSINFVPDAVVVFREVARVLRPGGLYRMMCANPFVFGLEESDWTGEGYLLRYPYVQGAEIGDPQWDVVAPDGSSQRLPGPREFRHTLHTIINGMAGAGFVLKGVWEELSDEPEPEPGTWEHLKSIAPPWLTFWAVR